MLLSRSSSEVHLSELAELLGHESDKLSNSVDGVHEYLHTTRLAAAIEVGNDTDVSPVACS